MKKLFYCAMVLSIMFFLVFCSVSCNENEETIDNDTNTNETQNQLKEQDESQHEQVKEEAVKKEITAVPTNKVEMKTNMGTMIIELDPEKAPITAKNFLEYVNSGFYDGTIFHRVINGFMIQGGGLTKDMVEKSNRPSIKNESQNGLKNLRGTVSMARKNDPHSATSQFFINHRDNASLDYPSYGGYAVFGKVIEGIEVVDKIAAVKTIAKIGTSNTGHKMNMSNVPVEPVVIESAKVITE